MKFILAFIILCLLFPVCWPIALVLLVLFIVFWILLLPFAIAGFTLGVIFKIVGAILLFPFKLLAAI